MFRFLYSTALASLILGQTATTVNAQDKKEAGVVEQKKVQTPLPTGGVSEEALGQMLTNLGLDPVKANPGGYDVKLQRGTLTYTCRYGVLPDGKRLLLAVFLPKLPEGDKLRADVLEKILRKNDEIGPTHFVCLADRTLVLVGFVENFNVTPGRLRRELDTILNTTVNTQSLWSPPHYAPIDANVTK